jgi:hypothetical protein
MAKRGPEVFDFAKDYGTLDYTNAVVLDIGADFGSSPAFFLSKGAKHVIACECDPAWYQRLEEWAKGQPVTVVGEVTPENIGTLVEQADVVKVDCEGCEAMLPTLPAATLKGPRAWVLETHTVPLYDTLTQLFKRLGYTVHLVRDHGGPNSSGKVCRVWTATRSHA